jgi:hypothetical protein
MLASAGFLTYVYLTVRSSFRTASCLGNINQVGLSVRMYADDYDGYLPVFAEWMDKSYFFSKNWEVYHCPEIPPSEGFGYGINNEFNRLTEIKRPDTYALIYDSGDIRKNAFGLFDKKVAKPPRHRGQFDWISYADGHYKTWPRKD